MNKLSINVAKTKYMYIKPHGAHNINMNNRIMIGNNILEQVQSYNLLRVIIDDKLVFDKFLKVKCNKINLRLYQLGKMRKYITSSIANIIYKQAVISLYDFADFLIESGPNFYQNRLNTLHEKALRFIDCNSNLNLSVDGLEYFYLLLSPVSRRHQHHCALMYRLSKQCNFLDKVRPDIHLHSRGKVKFKHKTTNLKGIDKSPFSRAKKLWDMIPENILKAMTKVKFKRDLTKIKL